jgi:hypothetical protein
LNRQAFVAPPSCGLLKLNYIPTGQANLANLLVPLLKLERLIGLPCGLSLIAIAQK